jgi:hypothetical protein
VRLNSRVGRLETARRGRAGPCRACMHAKRVVLRATDDPRRDDLGHCNVCGREWFVKVIVLDHPERVPGLAEYTPCT